MPPARPQVVTDAAFFLKRKQPSFLAFASIQDVDDLKEKMPLVNRYVQSICGLYSRVARQLKIDRSYVSRVARGQRHSEEVERALSTEFDRIVGDDESRAA
jgi:hypothetical protein